VVESSGPEGGLQTTPRRRRLKEWFYTSQRLLGWSVFIVYCLWNTFWLAQGRIPPALFKAATGLPAATTGGTRSVIHFWDGNWREALAANAMTVPIVALLALTLGWLATQMLRRRRLVLPGWFFWAWAVVIALAWILKFTGDRAYW
jgi:hypothetical protein